MSTKNDSKTAQVASGQDVERIRDIIFGPQMRNYEQQFQNMQRDLERLQQELDRLNEQITEHDSNQNKKHQTLRREMRQADDDLRCELRQTTEQLTHDKVDRTVLGELFIELGTHLKTGEALASLLQDLSDKIE